MDKQHSPLGGIPRTRRARVPFGPLEQAVLHRGGLAECIVAARSRTSDNVQITEWRLRRAWQRGRARGLLTVRAADYLSIALLGRPPCLLWEDWEDLDRYWQRPSARTVPAQSGRTLAA